MASIDTKEIINQIGGSKLEINDILSGGITLFLGIIAVGAFASIIYGGFQYMTAGGDASKVEKARKNITWAFIGVILAVSSFLIIRVVTGIFGK